MARPARSCALRDPGRHAQEGDRRRLRHLLLVVRQERDRDAVCQYAGRHLRHGAIDFIGWVYEGGGLELWNEFYQKELKLTWWPSRASRRARDEPVEAVAHTRRNTPAQPWTFGN